MTQKDFELIATVLKAQRDQYAAETASYVVRRTAESFADKLAEDNPRFKRDVFLRACGMEV